MWYFEVGSGMAPVSLHRVEKSLAAVWRVEQSLREEPHYKTLQPSAAHVSDEALVLPEGLELQGSGLWCTEKDN